MRTKMSMPSLTDHLRTHRSVGNCPSGKILLIPGSYPNGVAGKNSPYPFLAICENEPTSRLVEAEIVSDAGFRIKRVFLLIQKDEYAAGSDDLWPVVNEDIDKAWQRAYKIFCGRESGEAAPVIFRDQVGDDGRLAPYRPLFYCRRTQRFFHPPCPECGNPLELCMDDSLLVKNNLPAYSSSLSRYLYCEKCYLKKCAENPEASVFYVKNRKGGEPSGLADFHDLVLGFGGLLKKGAGLPCQECEHAGECFENGSSAEERIVAFSFFPFHMMAFEAPSVHAGDFISLLSGASLEEVARKLELRGEIGRKICLESLSFGKRMFLFENDRRLFHEILYLKLSFLGEFAKTLFEHVRLLRYPDLKISLDGIWVKLDQKNSMLPAFWNFGIVPIHIGGNAPESTFTPKLPPFFGLYGLSVLWFHTLLVNKRIVAARVLGKISEEAGRWVADGSDACERSLMDGSEEMFRPENVFYDPDKMSKFMPSESAKGKLPADLQKIWDDTLALGWSLLKSSMTGDRNWSEEEFFDRLDSIRNEVRSRLFSEVRSPEASVVRTFDDRDISGVLSRIAEKWRGKSEVAVAEEEEEGALRLEPDDGDGEFELEEIDEDEAETVVLSRDKLPLEESGASRSDEKILDPEFGEVSEDMPETVALPSNFTRGSKQVPGGYGLVGDSLAFDDSDDLDIGMEMDTDMEEDDESEADTVILSGISLGGKIEPDPKEADASAEASDVDDFDSDWGEEDDEDLAGTMLLSGEAKESPGRMPDRIPGAFSEEPDDFGIRGSEPESAEDDDFLSETVFLSTGKFKADDDNRWFKPTDMEKKNREGERNEKRPGPSDEDEDDDLMKTIIIDPKGFKDK